MTNGVLESNWNYAVTYLDLLFDDTPLASGSGFFWKSEDEKIYLITNWHNLSGRDPQTNQPLSEHGGIPNQVRFTYYATTPGTEGNETFVLTTATAKIELTSQNGDALWSSHPVLGQRVDIAALPIPTSALIPGAIIKPVNTLEGEAVVNPYPSQDVFVIGYPLGLITNLPIPIWKRGTIATEPSINPDALPKVYIDTATRKGMSGSIVIARHNITGSYQKPDGTMSNTLFSRQDKILGVYSGRISPHDVEAQLGIVWKNHLINEIVNSLTPPGNRNA